MSFSTQVKEKFQAIQDSICSAIELEDGRGKFQEDNWNRDGGGGGRTRVLQKGNVIEKGGVNFSAVEGVLPEKISEALGLNSSNFFATGVSIVMHPVSPMVPIIHMNIRYFETTSDSGEKRSWFGGGIDLTPHYINNQEAGWFHNQLKAVCDKHHSEYYSKFKKWADDYFFIRHRNETRGVGGIFFDRLEANEAFSIEQIFDFVVDVGNSFAPIYTRLMHVNKTLPFGKQEKEWQLLRRGRYVEFNLVYDKGTKFGLDTNGRIESILMSLPLEAGWPYDYQPEKGSKEEETQRLLKKGIDWTSFAEMVNKK